MVNTSAVARIVWLGLVISLFGSVPLVSSWSSAEAAEVEPAQAAADDSRLPPTDQGGVQVTMPLVGAVGFGWG